MIYENYRSSSAPRKQQSVEAARRENMKQIIKRKTKTMRETATRCEQKATGKAFGDVAAPVAYSTVWRYVQQSGRNQLQLQARYMYLVLFSMIVTCIWFCFQ